LIVVMALTQRPPSKAHRPKGPSTRLEEEDGDLAEVEVDEMLGLVGDVGTKIPTDDAMPGRVVFLVKFLFNVAGDVFFNVVLF